MDQDYSVKKAIENKRESFRKKIEYLLDSTKPLPENYEVHELPKSVKMPEPIDPRTGRRQLMHWD